MELPVFDKELKSIDVKLSIVPHPVNTDMAGIYWGSCYICAIPNGQIFDERKSGYVDAMGNVHRSRPEAIGQVKHFLHRLQNEPDFLETMTEPL
jgi:hypothetical protein